MLVLTLCHRVSQCSTKKNLFVFKADWTVLVLLQKPEMDPRIPNILHNIRILIKQTEISIHAGVKRNWNRRLRWLSDLINQPFSSRSKRAPLGFIGSLSHLLFGTVTEDELGKYQQAVKMAVTSVNRTIHLTNSLISVTKRSELAIADNQHRISNIGLFINNLTREIDAQFKQIQQVVNRMHFRHNIEHLLVSLEQACYFYIRQKDTYLRQRRSLEAAQLSEDIFPPEELHTIINKALKLQLHAPELSWFYSHIQVVPIAMDSDTLLYRTILPFHDGLTYLQYTFQSFPYPIADDLYVQFKLSPRLAVQTATGKMLIQHGCIGYNPYICNSGPLWSSSHFPCEKALISGDENIKGHCPIMLQNRTFPILHEPVPNVYVLSTHGNKIYQNCKGKSEKIVQLPSGVYYIQLNHTCLLKTNSWTLSGVQHIKQNSTFPVRPIIVDLASPLEKALHRSSNILISHFPRWNPIQEIITTNFSTLPPLPILSYVTPESIITATGIHSWLNSSTVIILLVLLLIVLACCYNMYKKKTTLPAVMTPSASSNIGVVQRV